MKEAEAKIDHPHQMLLYVEKPDGSYGTVQTGSYLAYNFMDDFQEKQRYFHETHSKAVLNGEISPIAYHMNMLELTVPETADRLGLSQGLVKRHMTPKYFAKLTVAQALSYAELFGIPVAQLFAFLIPPGPNFIPAIHASANPAVCTISFTARPQ